MLAQLGERSTDHNAPWYRPCMTMQLSEEPEIEEIKTILAEFPDICAVYLFGSKVRGDDKTESDVDLGLVFRKRGKSRLEHNRMLGELASRLEQITYPHHVDLVSLEEQGPVFCLKVLQEGRLIFQSNRKRRIDFESDVYVRGLDFLPTYNLATRGRIAGFRRWLEQEPL